MASQSEVRKVDNQIDKTENGGTSDQTFDRTKYDVQDLVYPSDLFNNEQIYGSNYVVFYISVTDEQRPIDAKGNTLGSSNYVPDFDSRVASSIQQINVNTGTALAGLAGQNSLGGAGIGAISSLLRGGSKSLVNIAKDAAIAGGLSTLPIAALATNGIDFQPARKRLKQAIMLHMPNGVKTTYSMGWGEADLKNFSIGAEIGDDISNIGDAAKKFAADLTSGSGGNVVTKGIDGIKKALSGVKNNNTGIGAPLAALALSTPNTQGLQAATQTVANPKKELLFNGVDFRSFTMHYQFFPRNQSELTLIENIILQFKYHMHPEFRDAKKFLYVYPSEFDITWYHEDTENKHLPKISTCALVNMEVDYTPQGIWATTPDGAPIQVNVSLMFRELATLTKETIRQGY